MSLKTVLIVSHDAGGANLLAHWCRSWRERVNFIYMLAGPALKSFEMVRFADTGISDFPNPSTIDFVVTSTGWQSALEFNAIGWAKLNSIPVASYLDHWVNYSNRFIREHKTNLPDEIWTGDWQAYNLAFNVFSKDSIKIRHVRNRYISTLEKHVQKQVTPSKTILICLEPIRKGISFNQVYSQLVQFLTQSKFKNLPVVIRDHPSATDTGLEYLKTCLKPLFEIRKSHKELWQDLARASVVAGYQSSVLAYACQLKIDAISYFPASDLEPILPHKGIEYI